MDPGQLILFLVLLGCSATFSGAESALTAINPLRVKSAADGGSRTAKLLETLLSDRSRLISALLIGNNLVNVGLTVLATMVVGDALSGLSPETAAGLSVAIVTVALVVFGEVIPKTIGVNLSMPYAMVVAWPIYFVRLILTPLTLMLSGLQNLTLKLFRHSPDADQMVTGEDLRTMVRVAQDQEVIDENRGRAISNLVSLHELLVREVMTPRIDVVGIPSHYSYEQVLATFMAHQYSRLPVYTGDIDNIVGTLHVRDLIGVSEEDKQTYKAELRARAPMFVPEQKRVEELIHDLRHERQHIAIVVDEYGGTSGLVTLEDLLEEVVGQIEDEFDIEVEAVRRLGKSLALIDASTTISEFEQLFNVDIENVDHVDTLAGLFLKQFGKIPEEGDLVKFQGITMVVRRMRGQRIIRLMVRFAAGAAKAMR